MEQNPAKVLHRFMIILPIIFLVGLLIFFFKDRMVGGAVLAGGGIALIFVFVYYYKIKKIRALAPHIPIEVDGGVKVGISKKCAQAGATHLVAASAVFDATDIEKAIQALKSDIL